MKKKWKIASVPAAQEILLPGYVLTVRRMRTDVLLSRHNFAYLACTVYHGCTVCPVLGYYSHLLLDTLVP